MFFKKRNQSFLDAFFFINILVDGSLIKEWFSRKKTLTKKITTKVAETTSEIKIFEGKGRYKIY